MSSNFGSRLTRCGLVSAALAALAVPVTVVATAAPAAAAPAPCNSSAPDEDNSSYVNQTAGVSANMRSGSSSSCGIKGWADNRDRLDYHCYVYVSSTNSTWTYLRNVTDGTYGWVSDSLLPGGGSSNRCDDF
ncbi:SH3 domain-containing protein [Streptomyces flaveus]|uniref:SH3 domain-containing protein n=1 Tax=Streptomyces flaveus TaxID=66370 RepID=UPI00332E2868